MGLGEGASRGTEAPSITVVIFYCDKCGVRVPEAELQSGNARKTDDVRALCGRCGGATGRRTTGYHLKRAAAAAATSSNLPADGAPKAPARPSSQTSALRPPAARAAAPAANKMALWGAIGAGGFVLILIIAVAASKNADERNASTTRPRQPAAQTRVPTTGTTVTPPRPTPPIVPAPPIAPAPTPPGGDTYDPRAFVAKSKLTEAKSFRDQNPGDHWTFDELLAEIVNGYRGTPSAEEAEQLRKTLDLSGERPMNRMNWHKDWENLTPHQGDSHWTMSREWDNRSYVLRTHPPNQGTPAEFRRTIKVPDAKPYLVVRTRGHDNGDFRCTIEIDGRRVLSEDVQKAWRAFCIDFSSLKGKEVEVRILHENTGWNHEHGFWLAPEFSAEKPAETQVLASADRAAPSTIPPLPVTMDWSKAVDLVALIDPATDSVEGSWASKGGAISGSAQQMGRLSVPYAPPEEYDLRAIATRTSGDGGLSFILPRRDAAVAFILWGKDNTMSGFEAIDGKRLADSPDRVLRSANVQNGRPYNIVIQVRKESIRAYVDDTPLAQTVAADKRLSVLPERKMPRREQLGLALWGTGWEIREFQFLAVTGEGRSLRGTVAQTTPGTSSGTPDSTPAAQVNHYAIFLDGLLQSLAAQSWEQARARLADAAKAPNLAKHTAALKADGECVALAEKVPGSETKGVALLLDGRAFTIVDTNDKRFEVGTGQKGQVLKASATGLQIKQNVGGGSLILDISLNSLTESTRLELSQLGLGTDAEGMLAMAAYRVGLLRGNERPADRQAVEELLKKAERQGAAEAPLAALRKWLAFLDRERDAKAALAALEALLAQTDHAAAKTAFDSFRKDFADSAVYAGVAARFPEFEKRLYSMSTQPGLWGGCWKSNKSNPFVEPVFQDVLLSVGWGNGIGPREKRFPNDWFSLRYGGLLRIEKAGTYKFHLTADDHLRIYINRKQVGNGKTVELTEGDHAFAFEYEDTIRNDFMKIEWTPPGENDKLKIPDKAFWHIPEQRARYLEPLGG